MGFELVNELNIRKMIEMLEKMIEGSNEKETELLTIALKKWETKLKMLGAE